MSSQSTIAFTVGFQASVNATANTAYYVTPGAMLNVTLQSSTGAIDWRLVIKSDNPNFTGQTLMPSSVTGTISIPLPVQACTFTITSETQDGQNFSSTTNTFYNFPQQTAIDRSCRLASNVNISALANANVASLDGATFLQPGQRVLLTGQTTTTQNGPYVHSGWANLAANLAILVRPPDFLTGAVLATPPCFEITEGTAWANSTWKYIGTVNEVGTITVDTSNVTFYPRVIMGSIVNVATSNVNVANLPIVSNSVFAMAVLNTQTSNTTANAQAMVTTSVTGGVTNGIVKFQLSIAGANLGNANYLVQNW